MDTLACIEIEARFLEVDRETLLGRLAELGAEDRGERLIKEIIFYDQGRTWSAQGKFVRLRQDGDHIHMTFKHHAGRSIDGTEEVELEVDNFEKARLFLERSGLLLARYQEKKRHTFVVDGVIADIDTWPRIPTYVEIEGPSEEKIRGVAERLGLDWGDAIFESAGVTIEKRYSVPVHSLTYFTFDRVE